ncbi:MAG: ATP-dependent zinc metalloprotease FtsH [Lachnospiraceae bacterium]|nr:ATP-dependent zinc metalloprotease FtsH [Lachnospiraceae bacterium]MDY5741676.1 ATP-dependent zinc metalloprotease FtsH [Lachnospiraceae bacterium]
MLILFFYYLWAEQRLGTSSYTVTQFYQELSKDNVKQVEIFPDAGGSGRIKMQLKDGRTVKFNTTKAQQIEGAVNDSISGSKNQKVELIMHEISSGPSTAEVISWIATGMGLGLVIMMLVMLFSRRNQGMGDGGVGPAQFGKSRARLTQPGAPTVTFADVAGLTEEKEELEEIVDFLKDGQKYRNLGARIPKGVMLVGPPGTGKTLLAKATAGEAGVPFFSISGSDFVEMFVGVGASRVRDLFADAKKHAPCIIFIDEIDAVARKRGSGLGGGHDEREQTLNQLLVEMDGFTANQGIIVMAATNRVDILDPAILRPGRFDRRVGIGRPDVRGREAILKVHARNKPLGMDVDLHEIARTTAGFTGADLENLMNEAAILAAKEQRAYLIQADIRQSFVKVGIGAEKKSKLISDKEKKITAYHEAGHAILFHVLPEVGPVHTISIIPTGMGAAGYTMPLPGEDEMFKTKSQLLADIMVGFGGRIAEDLIFHDVTTGASQDIKQTTAVARKMVTVYGMSDKLGMQHLAADEEEVFIGRDLAHTKSISETTAAAVDAEVKAILDDCYKRAQEILEAHRPVLDACAAYLLEHEKMHREAFEQLFDEQALAQA